MKLTAVGHMLAPSQLLAIKPTVCQLPPEKMPSHQFSLTQFALNPPPQSRASKKIHLTSLTLCVLFSIKTWMETQLLIEKSDANTDSRAS